MLRILLPLVFLMISCQPVAESIALKSESVKESGFDSDDVYFDELPENRVSRVTEKPNYDFLNQPSFWDEVEEISEVPSGKHCSNKDSYAHFGIARLVYQKIYSDLKLLPFGNQMRYVPFFDSYPAEPKDYELFLTQGLQRKLSEITRFTMQNFSVPLTLTSLTKHSGLQHDNHCRHRSGTVIDVRPLPSTEPMEWGDPAYDREMNLEFVKYILARRDVAVVFFNDPHLLNDREVKAIIREREQEGDPVLYRSVGGHDNHYHIEFDMDTEVSLVTDYIRQEVSKR